jgi:hypothetical protein
MHLKLRHIGFRILSLILILSFILLNLPQLMHCSNMPLEDDCCHVQKIVKPCCVKNIKLTVSERISGHCGCRLEDSKLPSDLYTDILNRSVNKLSETVFSYGAVTPDINYDNQLQDAIEYSPPNCVSQNIYLSNLNLRI